MLGKIQPRFSKHWKNQAQKFHGLEATALQPATFFQCLEPAFTTEVPLALEWLEKIKENCGHARRLFGIPKKPALQVGL